MLLTMDFREDFIEFLKRRGGETVTYTWSDINKLFSVYAKVNKIFMTNLKKAEYTDDMLIEIPVSMVADILQMQNIRSYIELELKIKSLLSYTSDLAILKFMKENVSIEETREIVDSIYRDYSINVRQVALSIMTELVLQ